VASESSGGRCVTYDDINVSPKLATADAAFLDER
jgi:hypothetical protein